MGKNSEKLKNSRIKYNVKEEKWHIYSQILISYISCQYQKDSKTEVNFPGWLIKYLIPMIHMVFQKNC